jgi:glycosyltransferase involved in cell wall biosynthesis
MKDIVLIPIYYRPEYLQLCLEHLIEAEGINDKEVWLLQDNHPDDQYVHKLENDWTQQVVNSWAGALNLRGFLTPRHTTEGNSLNTLEGYKRAYASGAERVYLVEDDVFVTPDFFEWHENVQNKGDFFCTVGNNCFWKNREKIRPVRDPAAYYTASWYGSYGVCWKRENMSTFLKHATNLYYNNMRGYIQTQLSNTPLGDNFTEQDGLIERTLILSGKKAAFPFVSRAYHMGFYGYHRDGLRPSGFLQQKIEGLREMIANPATIANKINNPYDDLEMFPEDSAFHEWNGELKRTEEF